MAINTYMRAYEILTEEELNELNRRDFLRQAGMSTMYVGLGAAALDQGSKADEIDKDEEDDSDEEELEKEDK